MTTTPPALTHRHIEVFRAVMAAGSVTGAAAALFTSQPTVSRELARMEHLAGLALFERVRGRLRPTAQAYALYDEVERSFVGLERIADTAVRLRQFTQGRVSVACLPAFAQALLPGACARFLAAHPGVSVSVDPVESPLLEERLAGQAYDLGVTEHDHALAAASVSPLLELDEVAVLPPGHDLLAKRRLAARDFAGQPFVSFHPRDRYRQRVDQAFAQAGVERRLVVETDSAMAVCAMVRRGIGLAIVNPLSALESGLPARALSFAIPFRAYAVFPAHRPGNALVGRFEHALRAECAELRRRVAFAWRSHDSAPAGKSRAR